MEVICFLYVGFVECIAIKFVSLLSTQASRRENNMERIVIVILIALALMGISLLAAIGIAIYWFMKKYNDHYNKHR